MGRIKTCKNHGPLTPDQIYIYKNSYTRCRLCDKIRSQKTKDKNPERYKKKCQKASQRYYQKHRERVIADVKAYQLKNRENLIIKRREKRKKEKEEREALKNKL